MTESFLTKEAKKDIQDMLDINGGSGGGSTLQNIIDAGNGGIIEDDIVHNTAAGQFAHAEGTYTTASGNCSHASGAGTKATNNYAHAEGGGTTASGDGSHAEGLGVTASGEGSHAEGSLTIASGRESHAEGVSTEASGGFSHAEGSNTTASGSQSHAEGEHTTASGNDSHAEGGVTTAGGRYSHAEGVDTTASGEASHTEGWNTTAGGDESHAEGKSTTANGVCSHTEGLATTADGEASHASGVHTTAKHRAQFVFGEYNVADPSTAQSDYRGTYIEIVGKGTDSSPSNARTLDWSGNETLAGKLTVGTAPVNDMDVVTKKYVDDNIGNRITQAESDIDSLESQFNTAVSAVTTDTEVTNIRVGADGTTYATAGEAVRSQVADLKSAISGLTDFALPIGDLQNGAYTATVGEALSNITGRHYYIDCSDCVGKIVTVKFTNTNTSSIRATAMCDRNQIVGQAYQQYNMTADGFVFGVTSRYKYLYISFDNGGASNFSVTVQGVISGMVDDISEINNKIGETVLSTVSQTLTGAIKEVNDKVDNIDIDNSGTEIGGVEVPVLDNPFGLKLYDIGGGHYRVNKRYNDFYKDADVNGIEWTRIYLNPVTGSDSNDGSQNSPVKTLTGAIGKTGTNIRVILPTGKYGVLNAGITGTVTNQSKNIMVECPDGVYEQRWGQLCSARTFTETSSGSGVWQNIAGEPVSVTSGNYYYKNAKSMSECESTPRSFFYSGGVLYIHTYDGTRPQTQFMEFAYPATTINAQTGAAVMILRNVHLTDALYKKGKSIVTIGGDSGITSLKTFVENVQCQKLVYSGYHTMYAKGLVIDGTPGSAVDGLTASKPCAVWLEGCVIRNTGADGYNYHNNGSTGSPLVVELECVGINCGMELEQTINNCTTLHENFQAIRIGGGYYNSRDRAVHDVGTSKSFNAFCLVRQAERAGNTTMDFAVGADVADTVEMYIYNCNMDGSKSTYNAGVFAGTGNQIKSFGTNLVRINGAEQIDAGWNPFAD